MFIYGLVVGLLLGTTLVLWNIVDRDIAGIVEKSTANVLNKVAEETAKLRERISMNEEDHSKEKLKQKKNQLKITSTVAKDSIVNNKSSITNNIHTTDSLPEDTITIDEKKEVNFEEVVIIRKDELIGTREIEIFQLDKKEEDPEETKKDSLLSLVSGVKEPIKSPNTIKIEFWKSPLNYRGYKMTRNLLVVYGIQPSDPMKIYKSENRFFLKTSNGTSKLDPTSEFRQFEKVKDENLLPGIINEH